VVVGQARDAMRERHFFWAGHGTTKATTITCDSCGDMKTSVPLDKLEGPVALQFRRDVRLGAGSRATPRVGSAARLAGYIGSNERLDDALVSFAPGPYADQWRGATMPCSCAPVRAGKIPVEIETPEKE